MHRLYFLRNDKILYRAVGYERLVDAITDAMRAIHGYQVEITRWEVHPDDLDVVEGCRVQRAVDDIGNEYAIHYR